MPARTRVYPLPHSAPLRVGAAPACHIEIASAGVHPEHAVLKWDGTRLRLDILGPTFVNGKPMNGKVILKPGDEISIEGAHLAIGLCHSGTSTRRRALTHSEFRHRVWEELARARRGGRETCLAMLRAKATEGGALAAVALDMMRAGDLIATYANDELELLLPDTPRAAAKQVIERLLHVAGLRARFGLVVGPQDGDNADRLIYAARCALRQVRSKSESEPPPPARRRRGPSAPVAEDTSTQVLLETLKTAAATESPIRLIGERNSGKGVFARWIHDHSPKSNGPFIVIRCASISCLDAAWTEFGDGGEEEPSRLASARGGTVLLDEVGDLPGPYQPILAARLREEAGLTRVVASSHRTLEGLLERGAFDANLAKALAGDTAQIPALRERPADILPLATAFAQEFAEATAPNFSPGAVARLYSYPWPGNVLELRNAIERAVRLTPSADILAEHLPTDPLPAATGDGALRVHVDSVERDAIVKALADSNHNQTHAARRLGVSRRALIYKMEKYGLKKPPRATR